MLATLVAGTNGNTPLQFYHDIHDINRAPYFQNEGGIAGGAARAGPSGGVMKISGRLVRCWEKLFRSVSRTRGGRSLVDSILLQFISVKASVDFCNHGNTGCHESVLTYACTHALI